MLYSQRTLPGGAAVRRASAGHLESACTDAGQVDIATESTRWAWCSWGSARPILEGPDARGAEVWRHWLAPDHPDIVTSVTTSAQPFPLDWPGPVRPEEGLRGRPRFACGRSIPRTRSSPTRTTTWPSCSIARLARFRRGPFQRGAANLGVHLSARSRRRAHDAQQRSRHLSRERALRGVGTPVPNGAGPAAAIRTRRSLRGQHQYHLGRMLVMARRPAEGVPFLREAEAIRLESFEKDDPRVAEVQLALGNALLDRAQAREGRALVRTSLENAEKRLRARTGWSCSAGGCGRGRVGHAAA